jgi:hypothetical protein
MRIRVVLLNVSCLFLSFTLITSGKYLCIDESGLACCLYFTKSGWHCIFIFLVLAYNLHSLPAIEKQGPTPAEKSQTLLTNKKQGNLNQVYAANIIKPM